MAAERICKIAIITSVITTIHKGDLYMDSVIIKMPNTIAIIGIVPIITHSENLDPDFTFAEYLYFQLDRLTGMGTLGPFSLTTQLFRHLNTH
jgi:hypothetical protein